MADSAARSSWIGTWSRAVVLPAWRRAGAVWVGCGLVAALTFGGNGMAPHDLTHLALNDPLFGIVLAAIWLLLFVPVARAIVRADGATYLRTLPHGEAAPVVVGGVALVAFQAPWLALWLVGEGARGLVVIAVTTLACVALAALRVSPRRARWPGWTSTTAALAAVHRRAIARKAGDAIVRGLGLAALAGLAAGLFVRNNALAGAGAATLGTSVALLVLVPARAGVLLVILESHRRARWLADSLGISPGARAFALVRALALVHVVATVVALAVAAIVVGADGPTLAIWSAVALGAALASAVAEAGVIARVQHRATAPAALVVGAVGVAALGMLALGLFGALGILGFAAVALAVALATEVAA